jgi:glycosyltransferase involved in cell wall biosynthesis
VIWAIVTGEYPPQPGGVADHSRLLANALAAAGDEVHVWAPAAAEASLSTPGVTVHSLRGGLGPRGLLQLKRELESLPRGARVLVQYVPHSFGLRAMNVPFCAWLAAQPRAVDLLVHELAYPFGNPRARDQLLAVTHRLMLFLSVNAAARVFVSVGPWCASVRAFSLREKPIRWFSISSNVSTKADPERVRTVRSTYEGNALVGHFGTFGASIAPLMEPVFTATVARDENRRGLLIGRGSRTYLQDLLQRHPSLVGRVFATGGLESDELAAHLAACDVLVQPYLDGASARRGTLVAGMALGKAIVSNRGAATDSLLDGNAVALAPDVAGCVELVETLLRDPALRDRLGSGAATLYQARLAAERTIEDLRSLS